MDQVEYAGLDRGNLRSATVLAACTLFSYTDAAAAVATTEPQPTRAPRPRSRVAAQTPRSYEPKVCCRRRRPAAVGRPWPRSKNERPLVAECRPITYVGSRKPVHRRDRGVRTSTWSRPLTRRSSGIRTATTEGDHRSAADSRAREGRFRHRRSQHDDQLRSLEAELLH